MGNTIEIYGLNIENTTMKGAINRFYEITKQEGTGMVFTPNAEIIMQAQRNEGLKEALNAGDMLIPDGAGVILGSKILKTPLIEKVSGVDLVKELLKNNRNNKLSYYFFGGKEKTLNLAIVNILTKYGKIDIKGHRNGFFTEDEEECIINDINKKQPDVLFVALGVPKQELWMYKNRHRINAGVLMGVGGTVDVLAGKAKLPPAFFRKAGLEWLFRLIKEPKRFKRMLDLPRFVILTIKTRLFGNKK